MGHDTLVELKDGITVVIPRIPVREWNYVAAIQSVQTQKLKPVAVIESIDVNKEGAAINRDKGLFQVETKWTAFLDDDDIFYPNHLRDLLEFAEETGADLVYPWFDVLGGTDPFPQFEGLPWDNDQPHQIPITHLVKTEAAWDVGGFSEGWVDATTTDSDGNRIGEDYNYILKLINAGYKIEHLNKRTWGWNHWRGNTSGLPSRW